MPASVSREQWFEAAKTGDLAALERWNKAGALKAQRFDPQSVTARAGEGRPNLARLVNGNQQGDLDALDTALFHYHIAYAIRLLELERFPPVANPALFTPLERAGSLPNARLEDIERRVGLLMDQGHHLDLHWTQKTPLEMAIAAGHVDRVELFLRLGADPTQSRHQNALYTAVNTVCGQDNISLGVVSALLDAGVDPNAVGGDASFTTTPLMYVAASWSNLRERHRDIAALLLRAGADPDLALSTERGDIEKKMKAEDYLTSPLLLEAFREEVARARAWRLEQRLEAATAPTRGPRL